jgi:hypothetical protein
LRLLKRSDYLESIDRIATDPAILRSGPMADVFLSYAREDRQRAAKIAQALEARGCSVWWDGRLGYGKSFHRLIKQELDASRCVVVLWSRASVDSDWVLSEAAEGKRRQILLPAIIDPDVRIPLEFDRLHTADLTPELSQSGEFEGWLAAIAQQVQPKLSVSDHGIAHDRSNKTIASTLSQHPPTPMIPAEPRTRRPLKHPIAPSKRSKSKAEVSSLGSTVARPAQNPPKNTKGAILRRDSHPNVSGDATLGLKNDVVPLRAHVTSIESPPTTVNRSVSAIFDDTDWRIDCKRCKTKTKYVHLRGDGIVGRKYDLSHTFAYDGTDTWKFEGNQLIISWSLGFSEETFLFVKPTDLTASGTRRGGPLCISRV